MRHNTANEVIAVRDAETREFSAREVQRHNLATESLGDRQLGEQVRHNKASEAISWAAHSETMRHNQTSEAEINRANLAHEAETFRSNTAREVETNRHNIQQESNDAYRNKIAQYNADIANAKLWWVDYPRAVYTNTGELIPF